ncbi:MAG: glycosyltransferase family 87 protein [Gemmatimonadales bacterium]
MSESSGRTAVYESGPVTPGVLRARRWLLWLYLASAVGVALQRTLLSTENNVLILRTAFAHLAGGLDLYAPYPLLHTDFFKYSPTFALLFAPFALLPLVPGYVLWAVACASAIFLAISSALPPRQAVLALALTWLATVGDMQRSQSNVLCAGLMILSWAWFEQGRAWRPAMAIAVATFVKIFPVVALAFAIFHPRRIRSGLIFAAVMLAGAALPMLVTAPSSLAMQYRSWYAIETRDVAPLGRYGTGGADLYAGIMGQFRVWWGVQWPHWPTQLAGVILLLAPLALRRRHFGSRHFRLLFLSSILVFCVLFNHQAESPSYSIAIIGTAIWFAVSERAWWRTALMAATLVIVDLMSTDLMPRAWYASWYVPYLVKTVPLIPVWVAMQGELLGVISNRDPSERAESDQGRVTAPEALAQLR